jgi:hypothetical protein
MIRNQNRRNRFRGNRHLVFVAHHKGPPSLTSRHDHIQRTLTYNC